MLINVDYRGVRIISESDLEKFIDRCLLAEQQLGCQTEAYNLRQHLAKQKEAMSSLLNAATKARDMLAQIRGWTGTYKELARSLKRWEKTIADFDREYPEAK